MLNDKFRNDIFSLSVSFVDTIFAAEIIHSLRYCFKVIFVPQPILGFILNFIQIHLIWIEEHQKAFRSSDVPRLLG